MLRPRPRSAGVPRAGAGLVAALLTVVAALALPLAAGAQTPQFYGVATQGPLATADYERMRAGNVGTLRFQISWRAVEPSPGSYRWEATDEVIGTPAAHGVRVLPVVHGRPPDGVRSPPTRASDRQAYRGLLENLARRYGPGGEYWGAEYLLQHPLALGDPQPVSAWQLGNEQNGRHHWGGKPNPRAYGRLVLAGARGVRSVHRAAEIVLGGMFATPSGRGSIISWRFLKRLYGVKGIKRAFDTVAVHPYSPNLRGLRIQMRRIRAVMRRSRDRAGAIRVTEVGWGSARNREPMNKGPKGQARMLRSSFRLLTRHRHRRNGWNVRGINWFSWQDGGSPCPFCDSSGLFSGPPGERKAKPSWRAFTRFAR